MSKRELNKIAKYLWIRGIGNIEKDIKENIKELIFDVEYFCMKKEFGIISKDDILNALEKAKQL